MIRSLLGRLQLIHSVLGANDGTGVSPVRIPHSRDGCATGFDTGCKLLAMIALTVVGSRSVKAAKKPEAVATDSLRIIQRQIPEDVLRYRRSLPETRPPLRGFRAPILENQHEQWPLREPGQHDHAALHQAAADVGRDLARRGLLATTLRAVKTLAEAGVISEQSTDEAIESHLRAIGIPLDLLRHFQVAADRSQTMTRFMFDLSDVSNSSEAIEVSLRQVQFAFHKTRSDFRIATESGEHDLDSIRLQLTRGSYWEGQGDGGNIDLTRQLIHALPDASFLISIERPFVDEFARLAGTWSLGRADRVTLLAEEFVIAQWAQDNGKSGFVDDGGNVEHATLAPRYASRGEDGSTFVPGESFAAEGWAAAGHIVLHSPLLFQGGNLLAVREPATNQRILLIGEAEIYRNTALGLTHDQVMEAFRIEFDVDRCIVLPAVTFHIDYDLCVRAHDGKLIAFVNDTMAAVRIILKRGLDVLEKHSKLDAAAVKSARAGLSAGRIDQYLNAVMPVINRSIDDANAFFPLSLAELFSINERDSGIGNFQRFLLALDIAASSILTDEQRSAQHAHTRSYTHSLARREVDRDDLAAQLRQLGFEVVPVPSLSDADRSINTINGIHDRTRYVMPAYGGLFGEIDEAAAAVFRRTLGPSVRVIPILCSESQRRVGGVHCSAAAYYKPQ